MRPLALVDQRLLARPGSRREPRSRHHRSFSGTTKNVSHSPSSDRVTFNGELPPSSAHQKFPLQCADVDPGAALDHATAAVRMRLADLPALAERRDDPAWRARLAL